MDQEGEVKEKALLLLLGIISNTASKCYIFSSHILFSFIIIFMTAIVWQSR